MIIRVRAKFGGFVDDMLTPDEIKETDLKAAVEWRNTLVVGWKAKTDAVTKGEYWVLWTSPGGLYYWLHPTENRWVGEPEQKTMPTFATYALADAAMLAAPRPVVDEKA